MYIIRLVFPTKWPKKYQIKTFFQGVYQVDGIPMQEPALCLSVPGSLCMLQTV